MDGDDFLCLFIPDVRFLLPVSDLSLAAGFGSQLMIALSLATL